MFEFRFPYDAFLMRFVILRKFQKWQKFMSLVLLSLILLFTGCKKDGYAKVPKKSVKEELAAMQQEDLVNLQRTKPVENVVPAPIPRDQQASLK